MGHSRKWLPGIGTVSYRPFTQSIYWKLESRNLIGQSRKANWCFELQFARADTLRERAPISHPFWIPRSQTIVKKTVFALYFLTIILDNTYLFFEFHQMIALPFCIFLFIPSLLIVPFVCAEIYPKSSISFYS